MSDTMKVGKRLVDLCRTNANLQAVDELYADDIVSVEAASPNPNVPATIKGKHAVREKSQKWLDMHTVHGGKVSDPMPNGDRFIVEFDFDVTAKSGPMAGKRMQLHETGLYTVSGGKVVKEEFFYFMG